LVTKIGDVSITSLQGNFSGPDNQTEENISLLLHKESTLLQCTLRSSAMHSSAMHVALFCNALFCNACCALLQCMLRSSAMHVALFCNALFCNARCALLQCTLLQCTLRDSAMHVALFCNARCASNAAYDSSILSAMTLVDACSLFCANYMYRVGHNRIPYMTIYDRIFGDVPAKKHSMYNVYIWFWPTLDMCILKS